MSNISLIAGAWTAAGSADADNAGNVCSPDYAKKWIGAAGRKNLSGSWFNYLDLPRRQRRFGFSTLHSVLGDNDIDHLNLEVLDNWSITDDRRYAADRTRTNMLLAAETTGPGPVRAGGKVGALGFTAGEFHPAHIAGEFDTSSAEAADTGNHRRRRSHAVREPNDATPAQFCHRARPTRPADS